jgi:hypothetical protein
MAKYHVKKDGTPGVCRAQEGNCPLGDSSQHFSSKEEAQDYADKVNENNANNVTEKPKKEIKSIQIPNMNQEEVQDEIDYHLNREEGRQYESLAFYTHEILNDKSMLGNEDNEFINTLRKEFGDKTNKIIQPERSFEDTVSQVLFDKGLRYAYEYDYKDKEERDEYINSIKSEFKPKFEINGEKFYVSYAEGKGNFFDRLNRIAIDKYNSK